MKIDRNSQVARSAAPVQTTVGSEIVLMVLETGKCFGLGETGSDVWRLLEKPTSVQPVLDALAAEYDAPMSVIEADVLELLTELQQQGLLVVS
jgi:hypothetical protein